MALLHSRYCIAQAIKKHGQAQQHGISVEVEVVGTHVLRCCIPKQVQATGKSIYARVWIKIEQLSNKGQNGVPQPCWEDLGATRDSTPALHVLCV